MNSEKTKKLLKFQRSASAPVGIVAVVSMKTIMNRNQTTTNVQCVCRRLVPVHDGLHGHNRHDPDRRAGGALELQELFRLLAVHRNDPLSDVRMLGLGRRLD